MVQDLEALTQNDAGAAIALTSSANAVSNRVILNALNAAGTALAAGGHQLCEQHRALTFQVSSAVGKAASSSASTRPATWLCRANGPIAEVMIAGVPIGIAAQNLAVRTQLEGGAAITLTNPDNRCRQCDVERAQHRRHGAGAGRDLRLSTKLGRARRGQHRGRPLHCRPVARFSRQERLRGSKPGGADAARRRARLLL